MKSAYLVLGVPGNASLQDIESAFEHASALYTPKRIASEEGAAAKLDEIRTAYQVLRDPSSREAHDRKLAGALKPQPQVRVIYQEESPSGSLLRWGLVLVGLLFAAGYYVSWRNAEARQAQATLELAAKQKAEREAQEQKLAEQRAEQERVQARLKQEAEERRFTIESQMAANRASIERMRQEQHAAQMQRMSLEQQRRQEAEARLQEQRAEMEARRRVEDDKRRIREMCLQLYRRSDC